MLVSWKERPGATMRINPTLWCHLWPKSPNNYVFGHSLSSVSTRIIKMQSFSEFTGFRWEDPINFYQINRNRDDPAFKAYLQRQKELIHDKSIYRR